MSYEVIVKRQKAKGKRLKAKGKMFKQELNNFATKKPMGIVYLFFNI